MQFALLNIESTAWGLAAIATLVAIFVAADQHPFRIRRRHGKLAQAAVRAPGIQLDATSALGDQARGVLPRSRR